MDGGMGGGRERRRTRRAAEEGPRARARAATRAREEEDAHPMRGVPGWARGGGPQGTHGHPRPCLRRLPPQHHPTPAAESLRGQAGEATYRPRATPVQASQGWGPQAQVGLDGGRQIKVWMAQKGLVGVARHWAFTPTTRIRGADVTEEAAGTGKDKGSGDHPPQTQGKGTRVVDTKDKG